MTPEIAQRLEETVAWCSRHANVDDADASTRTPALRPPLLNGGEGWDLLNRLHQSPPELRAIVDYICERRREQLARLAIPLRPVATDLAGGRILYTDFRSDLCEAATEPSNGYFDLADIPGWDTWFHYLPSGWYAGLVYCWVPPQLVELADRGLQMIPTACVQWLESLGELETGPLALPPEDPAPVKPRPWWRLW